MHIDEVFRQLVKISLLAGFLAVGLLIIKLILKDKLNAQWHYAIWLVLLIRLLVPFTPSASFNIINLVPYNQPVISVLDLAWAESPTAAVNTVPASEPGTSLNLEPLPAKQQFPDSIYNYIRAWINWQTLAMAWAMGLVAIWFYLLVVNALLYYRTRRLPTCESEAVAEILQECQTRLNIPGRIPVLYDSSLASPALVGMNHPRIIISPDVVGELSREELRYIFLHELSHIKRRDLQVNAVVLAIQSIYWFNPVIWYSLRQMKQDCEIACDATALAALSRDEHRPYGHTIVRLLQLLSEPHWVPGTLGFVSKFNRRRISMITKYRKMTLTWAVMALALTMIVGCSSLSSPFSPKSSPQNQALTDNSQPGASTGEQPNSSQNSSNNPTPPAPSNTIVYQNTQYGFSFTLPSSWQAYTIVASTWEGNNIASGKVTENGPMISIRHPQWTEQNPRQDIPILVLTIEQWNSLQKEIFHIGAAPIPPSELGRNSKYVFALPARYNFAFPAGFEEVENIVAGHPLKG
jgi:beta-lactamase regulating signal transducer with metallopeptidase domain